MEHRVPHEEPIPPRFLGFPGHHREVAWVCQLPPRRQLDPEPHLSSPIARTPGTRNKQPMQFNRGSERATGAKDSHAARLWHVLALPQFMLHVIDSKASVWDHFCTRSGSRCQGIWTPNGQRRLVFRTRLMGSRLRRHRACLRVHPGPTGPSSHRPRQRSPGLKASVSPSLRAWRSLLWKCGSGSVRVAMRGRRIRWWNRNSVAASPVTLCHQHPGIGPDTTEESNDDRRDS
jgi:hypothetical protein